MLTANGYEYSYPREATAKNLGIIIDFIILPMGIFCQEFERILIGICSYVSLSFMVI
mgnify:FL=1